MNKSTKMTKGSYSMTKILNKSIIRFQKQNMNIKSYSANLERIKNIKRFSTQRKLVRVWK